MGEKEGPRGRDLGKRGWRERLGELRRTLAGLLATRAAILREELEWKRASIAKAGIWFGLASVLAALALFLFAAFSASLFARLWNDPVLGILTAFLLYAVAAAAAGLLAWKSLSRVKPFDFPLTRGEIQKDWQAIRSSAEGEMPYPTVARGHPETAEAKGSPEKPVGADEGLEQRFRAGSE